MMDDWFEQFLLSLQPDPSPSDADCFVEKVVTKAQTRRGAQEWQAKLAAIKKENPFIRARLGGGSG